MIRWTQAERAQVAERMVDLMEGAAYGMTFAEALRQAQSVLPADRQRPLVNPASDRTWADPLLAKVRAERQEAFQRKAEAARTSTLPPPPATQPGPVSPAQAAIPSLGSPAFRQAVEDVLFETVRGVALRLLSDPAIRAAFSTAAAGKPMPEPEPTLHRPEKNPRKRVLVFGLLPSQSHEILDSFGQQIDLRCMGSNEFDRLRSQLPAADACVLMTNFIDHAAENIVKSSGVAPVRVSGGMTKLRETLRQFVRV